MRIYKVFIEEKNVKLQSECNQKFKRIIELHREKICDEAHMPREFVRLQNVLLCRSRHDWQNRIEDIFDPSFALNRPDNFWQ